MSAPRRVAQLLRPVDVLEGAGVRLKRSFPRRELSYVDPFLLLDHFGSDDPGDYLAGFPMHPHRGIETVTYMLAGRVDHRDSLGNAGTIGAGDVQWMTSGSGILHEEMPKPFEGRMEGFQLWVNLPARLKMSAPSYREVRAAEIPWVARDGVRIGVIAGRVEDARGPVTEIAVDPTYLDVRLEPGARFAHAVEPGHTVLAYVYAGEGVVGDETEQRAERATLAVLGDGGEVLADAGETGMRLLLFAGRPWHEPVARYGPFVMNTQEEIRAALADLRDGTFIKSPPRGGELHPGS